MKTRSMGKAEMNKKTAQISIQSDKAGKKTADHLRVSIDQDISSLGILERALKAINANDSQVLKKPFLDKLYLFLVDFTKYKVYHNVGFQICDYTVNYIYICSLSSFLFSELSRKFELVFSCLRMEVGQSTVHSEDWGIQEDLILLLRCCMGILHLLAFDVTVLIEKCRILLTILRNLCSPDLVLQVSHYMKGLGKRSIVFKKSISCEWMYTKDGDTSTFEKRCVASTSFSEHSTSPVPLLCSVLEVFVDELLAHRELRQHFKDVEAVSFTNEKLFKDCSIVGDSNAVLEVIAAHFLLSVHDVDARKKFLDILLWRHCKKAPYLSLFSAMQLLGSPVMLSAPKTFQAYMILMVSICIGIDMASDDQEVDSVLMNYYVSAFERSFTLYATHISCLQLGGHHYCANRISDSSHKPFVSRSGHGPSFESYIRPVTYNSINHATNFGSFETNCEPFAEYIAYIKENEQIHNKSVKADILSVLSYVVSQTLSGHVEGIAVCTIGVVNQDEAYHLASIMKLMSNSLLQVIQSMQSANLVCEKTTKDHSLSTVYDVIFGICGSLLQCSNINSHSTQKLLDEVMGSNPTSHKESKLMIMHIADLLIFCYDRGYGYLWKGCIVMMMSLMHLIMFEDGDLEALKALFARYPTKPSKALVVRSSTLKIASSFRRFRKLSLREDKDIIGSQDGQSETPHVAMVGKEEDTCNGETYLNLVLAAGGNKRQSDLDDLADFIECKPGKDYSKWLKDLDKHRVWKYEKRAGAKREKRKQTVKFLKGIYT
ncbi:hypothetical protein IFM89_031542 [Coptis chinensis]|uniref:DUF7812 domain-containing protein n=1 Tax=Coptis chinensis TaxID=261450 RepID=A0A835IJ89_9MAGN|nr:hypothetical protein IFM89_031542 [Coptis chinensis]